MNLERNMIFSKIFEGGFLPDSLDVIRKYYDKNVDEHQKTQKGLPLWKLIRKLKWNLIQSYLPTNPKDKILDAAGEGR